MKSLLYKVITLFISILDKIVPKNNNFIVYNSFPDFSDNSFALFIHIMDNYNSKIHIWLVKQYKPSKYFDLVNEYSPNKNYKIIKRDSILGVYYYLRSKYVFFTHGLYGGSEISPNHTVVNLWHGMPLKKVGLLDGNFIPQKFSCVISTSFFYQKILAKVFGVNEDKVLPVGQPRNDLLFKSNECLINLGIKNIGNKKKILWTPTYRQSIIGDIRIDGFTSSGFPVIKISELNKLNSFLESIDSLLLIKLHPMDVLNEFVFEKYTNIKIFNNNSFEKANCHLSSLLGHIDILLTDFSGIYIDFLLMNKPIGFVINDFNEYANSRGFIFDDINELNNLMPGERITSFEEMKDFLNSVITLKKDVYKSKRDEVNKRLNKTYGNYSSKLLDEIGFN